MAWTVAFRVRGRFQYGVRHREHVFGSSGLRGNQTFPHRKHCRWWMASFTGANIRAVSLMSRIFLLEVRSL